MSIPVAVCDPLPIYRRGLLVGVGEAALQPEDPEDLEAWLEGPGRRAVLMTAHLPANAGLLRKLCGIRPDLTVVALLEPATLKAYEVALEAGAAAAVPWNAPLRTVVCQLRAALQCQLPTSPLPDGLFPWEALVVRSLTGGATIAEVGRRFGCSEPEMWRILRDLYDRLGARDGADHCRTGTTG
jgi:DNA-binding NarL/FixJ family response regulator